jgi:hypothetical protein
MNNSTKLIGAFILFAGFVFSHSSIQQNTLGMGFSWTLATIAPYVLQFLAALLISNQIARLLKTKGGLIQRMIFGVALLALCGIAFAFNKIYEGDFANGQQDVALSVEHEKVFNPHLTMAALPGCGFCFAKIPMLNALKSRNPNLNVSVLIMGESEHSYTKYRELLDESIKIDFSEHGMAIAPITRGKFPSFFFLEEDGTLRYWPHVGFGMRALDWIENNHR